VKKKNNNKRRRHGTGGKEKIWGPLGERKGNRRMTDDLLSETVEQMLENSFEEGKKGMGGKGTECKGGAKLTNK